MAKIFTLYISDDRRLNMRSGLRVSERSTVRVRDFVCFMRGSVPVNEDVPRFYDGLTITTGKLQENQTQMFIEREMVRSSDAIVRIQQLTTDTEVRSALRFEGSAKCGFVDDASQQQPEALVSLGVGATLLVTRLQHLNPLERLILMTRGIFGDIHLEDSFLWDGQQFNCTQRLLSAKRPEVNDKLSRLLRDRLAYLPTSNPGSVFGALPRGEFLNTSTFAN